FYPRLIDLLFKNLDSQRSIESYIAREEQERIAAEIHDTVLQKLFGAACRIRVMRTNQEENTEEALAALEKTLESSMTELREAIYDRHFEGGTPFLTRLEQYLTETERLCGVTVRRQLDVRAVSLTPGQKTALYRIICEAVNNAVRHGGAHLIEVELTVEPEQVSAAIQDDGGGFSPTQRTAGNGLHHMCELAALLKGQLGITSAPGAGCRIALSIPR
ncbi:MAG: sensor histidine kinase, partial [Clostridiales bacterium]|nr:sensor histidine kinase [Clostridiales bacterium]